MRMRAILLGVFLALAAAIALWSTRAFRPAEGGPAPALPQAGPAEPLLSGQAVGEPQAKEPGRMELGAAESEDGEVPVIIRGRCLDEEGRPR